jgi:hypothetical protein
MQGIYHLFPCETWVTDWKEDVLQIIVFKVKKGSFCSKQAYSPKEMEHMYLSKGNRLWWKHLHLARCFPLRLELFLQGILTAT